MCAAGTKEGSDELNLCLSCVGDGGRSSRFDLQGATAAYQRTSALKLIQSVPEAQVALFNGETTLSTMAATQGFIRKVEAEEKQVMNSTVLREPIAVSCVLARLVRVTK